MSDLHEASAATTPGLSYASVADLYDRARPSYPAEAVAWMVGPEPRSVLELGAGTGKLTEVLLAAGHRVVATDPLPQMLAKLRERAPGAHTAIATAEGIPIPSRSIDVVVCAESFHWFDHPRALAEITRVLREEGHLALVWNVRDEGIPWVRKLGAIIGGGAGDETAHAGPVEESETFAAVEEQSFRNWQDLRKDELLDLVRTRSRVATLPEHQREDVLARVASLYDDYGRGPDGMRLPYLTRCYRAKVTNQPPPPVVMQRVEDEALSLLATEEDDDIEHSGPLMPGATKATVRTEDTGTLLIDFS